MRRAKNKTSWFMVGLLTPILMFTAACANLAWEKYMAAGYEAYQHSRYAEAEKSYQAAVKEVERFGPHDRLALTLTYMGLLYQAQGRYADAEPLFKRALTIMEQVLGPEHPGLVTSLNNLAELYLAQGQYAEAEPLFKRSLAIDEKALGPNHPDLAIDLYNLAKLYRAQGRYAEAEPLLKRSFAIAEKALGERLRRYRELPGGSQ